MFIRYQTKAVLLKEQARGEGDILLSVFSQQYGKIEILARSLRKVKSKLRGETELFSLVLLEYIQGKHYKTLTNISRVRDYSQLKKTPAKLKVAFQVSRTLIGLIENEERDKKIWELLLETLGQLDDYQLEQGDSYFNFSNKILLKNHWPLKLIYHYFFWSLIEILGYKPELYHCALCQKKLRPEGLYFSFRERGVLCNHCFERLEEGDKKDCLEIEPNLIKIVRLLVEKQWSLLQRLQVTEKEKIAIDGLLNIFA